MALEIIISKNSYRVGEGEPPTVEVTGSSGNIRWTCNFGACVPDNEVSSIYSPENVSHYAAFGDAVAIMVTDLDSSEVASVRLDSFATFPYQPDWGFESEVDEDTEISVAEDNSETAFEGVAFGLWPLTFEDREFDQYREVLLFRMRHGKTRFFFLQDIALDELHFGRFDSSIKRKPLYADGVSYSFVFKCPRWTMPSDGSPEGITWQNYGIPNYGNYGG